MGAPGSASCDRCDLQFDGLLYWHEGGCVRTLGRPVARKTKNGKRWIAPFPTIELAIAAQQHLDAKAPPREKCADCGLEFSHDGEWHALSCPRVFPKGGFTGRDPSTTPEWSEPRSHSPAGAQHVGRAHLARNIVNQVLEQAVEYGALQPGNERARQEFNDVADGFVVELLEEHDRTRDEIIARLRRGR